MPRLTKIATLLVFLLLLAMTASYVVLTWHVADPFRFRYVGHGEVVMQPLDPMKSPSGPQVAMVPIHIEMQNTASLPIHLMFGKVRAMRDRDFGPGGNLDREWELEGVPRHGTVPLVTLVTQEEFHRLEREPFVVSYQSVSETQRTAYELVLWLREKLRGHIDIAPMPIHEDQSVTPLTVDPAHP